MMALASVIRKGFDPARADPRDIRAYIDDLEFAVERLGAALAPADATATFRRVFHLSPTQARLLSTLADGRDWTKASLHDALYGYIAGDAPEIKILDVLVTNIRARLAPFGLSIETIWGVGFRLPPASVAALQVVADGGDVPDLPPVPRPRGGIVGVRP